MGPNSLEASPPSYLLTFFQVNLQYNHCFHCYYNYNKYICKLNPLTKDRCGKGAWWNWRELQVSLEGSHDNPMSGIDQALTHWDLQWRNQQILTKKHPKGRKGWEQKMRKQHSNMSKMIDYRESSVKYSETSIKWTPSGPSQVSILIEGVRLVEVCKNCAMFVND